MSFDAAVWTAVQGALPDILPESALWVPYHSHLGDWVAYEAESWQLLVSVDVAQPSSAVLNMVPEAKYRYAVTLEPIGAPQAGYAMLDNVCRALAKTLGGCLEDSSGQTYLPT